MKKDKRNILIFVVIVLIVIFISYFVFSSGITDKLRASAQGMKASVDKEFNKYLFLCGEKIKKSQWKKLDDNDKFYTYEEWETSIKNKYTVYSMKALEQFYKYLNHCQRKIQPHKEFINPYVSALFTAVMTFYITVLCTETIDKKQISLNCEFVITLILLLVIVV